jgi:hypothetical protein
MPQNYAVRGWCVWSVVYILISPGGRRLYCTGGYSVPFQIHVFLGPQNVIIFGEKFVADVIS